MTRTDPLTPCLALRLQTFWARALVSLLLALVGHLLGWQLTEGGHSRLALASQTSPLLPELRPMQAPQPSVQGLGAATDAPAVLVLARWPDLLLPLNPVPVEVPAGLAIYGRMNLDGG